MTFGDLFSGIGGFRLGLERAGMQCKWSCEIDKWCRAVYRKHWPDSIIYEDISELHHPQPVDLLCGGFPCQDLSVAGRRAGLSGARSGLFFEFVRLLEQIRPKWFLLENVPGFLSSRNGADFGNALAALDECGYGVSWRILDAQYFGLAQRRKRVWIVGHLGGSCPVEILFESQGVRGNTPKSGKTGEETSRSLRGRPNCSHRADAESFIVNQAMSAKWSKGTSGPSGDEHHNLICIQDARGQRDKAQNGIGIQSGGPMFTLDGVSQHAVAAPLRSRSHPNSNAPGRGGEDDENIVVAHSLRADGFDASEDGTGRGTPIIVANTLGTSGGGANDENRVGAWIVHENISGNISESDTARALRSGASHSYQFIGAATDAERVREAAGIPRRLDAPDGPRYKGLGNAVPVPVVEWIGRRIMQAHTNMKP